MRIGIPFGDARGCVLLSLGDSLLYIRSEYIKEFVPEHDLLTESITIQRLKHLWCKMHVIIDNHVYILSDKGFILKWDLANKSSIHQIGNISYI